MSPTPRAGDWLPIEHAPHHTPFVVWIPDEYDGHWTLAQSVLGPESGWEELDNSEDRSPRRVIHPTHWLRVQSPHEEKPA